MALSVLTVTITSRFRKTASGWRRPVKARISADEIKGIGDVSNVAIQAMMMMGAVGNVGEDDEDDDDDDDED